MCISYRKYKAEDRETVKEYIVQLCKYVARFNPSRRKSPQANFAEIYLDDILQYSRRKQGVIYVAIYNDLVVGFCSAYTKKQSKKESL
jgi:hypothetical protein